MLYLYLFIRYLLCSICISNKMSRIEKFIYIYIYYCTQNAHVSFVLFYYYYYYTYDFNLIENLDIYYLYRRIFFIYLEFFLVF